MGAVAARTGAAGHADGIGYVLVLEPETVGIEDALGVADLAAERDRILRRARRPSAPGLRHRACDRKIAGAIRHLRELGQDLDRRLQGVVHVPDRAGATE